MTRNKTSVLSNKIQAQYKLSTLQGWLRDVQGYLAVCRARIFKLLRSPRIDSKEPFPSGCVAWRAGTTTLIPLVS